MSNRINLLLCLIFGHSWVTFKDAFEPYELRSPSMKRGFRGKWCSCCHAFRMFDPDDKVAGDD